MLTATHESARDTHVWSERHAWPELAALRETGADFHHRGWSLGTSSNYSVVLQRDPLRLLLTASSKDKGRLTPHDFVLLDGNGAVLEGAPNRPSAETALHLVLARHGAGAVLHTHSVAATLLSELHAQAVSIEGYEMLKGLSGYDTHAACKHVAIFDNTQDIPTLARDVEARLDSGTDRLTHGFLLRGHGLYAWGRDLLEARRHIEVLEFLFQVQIQKRTLHAAFKESQ